MSQPQKVSQKANNTLCFLIMLMLFGSELRADVNTDEDVLFFDMTVKENFQPFFIKYHRYPRTWHELKIKSSCYGGKNSFPKSNEVSVWHPSECELSYQLVYSNNKAFKVVALKNGHIVSIFENYKATYLKTPYHSHELAICSQNAAC